MKSHRVVAKNHALIIPKLVDYVNNNPKILSDIRSGKYFEEYFENFEFKSKSLNYQGFMMILLV